MREPHSEHSKVEINVIKEKGLLNKMSTIVSHLPIAGTRQTGTSIRMQNGK